MELFHFSTGLLYVLLCECRYIARRIRNCFTFLQDCLSPLSMQALPASAESLCIVELGATDTEDVPEGASGLFLNIGLQV